MMAFASAPPHQELPVEELRWTCPPEMIPADTTEGVEPIEGIIGQDRALKALKLGVELFSPGYNIFVCGLSGTGKATTIKTILEKIQPHKTLLRDLCYVHNFENEDEPVLLTFERGQGAAFKAEMAETLAMIRERLPGQFEEEEFVKKRKSMMEEFNRKNADLYLAFEKEIQPDGFVVGRVQEGQSVHPDLMLRIQDKVFLMSDIHEAVDQQLVTAEQAEHVLERYRVLRVRLEDVFREGMKLNREFQRTMHEQERDVLSVVVNAAARELVENFPDPKVQHYLTQAREFILDNVEEVKKDASETEEESFDFSVFDVNLLLDSSTGPDCPVVIETNPTFRNVFGTVERQQDGQGFWLTNFTMIKSGSLLRADGGFLVLNAADTLTEPGVWKMLQRVLLYRKLEIQSIETLSQQSVTAMKPEAIDVNVKVILIGNNEIYGMLSAYERDFKKIFKVKADFDYEMQNTDIAVKQYTALVRKLISDEGLKHFDRDAIAAIVEYGARLVENKGKLTTQFSEIADIAREANYWCRQNSNRYVMLEHVVKAYEEARNRHSLFEEKMQEMIEDHSVLIDVSGARIGQINGLAVYGGERFYFGKPTRITAAVGAGRTGIINIEREAGLSGSTHDKGVLILAGYLRERFAQEHPLTLAASLSFEQSYSGVDGDSASSTEIYALLSALSGIPLRQDVAVTGSVNQKGVIQPIGGVNEKIEGFFQVCEAFDLTGEQGVVIPVQNVQNLMLHARVVEAVRQGRFHIWTVSTIEEGIEILTGVKAGSANEQGRYPTDTVFGRAQARLDDFYQRSKERES
jgi:lon-related putative ATP-dependent protease